ncbi:MAG: hypothetical protein OXG44_01590 [Gammaproteobacteria bacterium]|nr:hypothetical protein [Gammaproteobacteria bacterium]
MLAWLTAPMADWLLFPIAVLCLLAIPWVPQLVRLRIRFLRWIHWEWGARLLEDHFAGWCSFFRVAFAVLAVVLLFIGWRQMT